MAANVAQLFEVDRKRFASGLFWHPLSWFGGKAQSKEVTAVSKQLGLPAIVWRRGVADQLQAGLGSKEAIDAYSAACVISKTLEVERGVIDFACAVQVPDGRWLYVAQKDGVMLPDGDLLGTEAEIRERLINDCSVSDFALVIAPTQWGLPAEEAKPFVDFLPRRAGKVVYHRWWQLRPTRSTPFAPLKRPAPVLALTVAAVGGAFLGWQHWRAEQLRKAAEEAARLAAAQAAQPQTQVIIKPWAKIPTAPKLTAACLDIMRVLRYDQAGWKLSQVQCDSSGVRTMWVAETHASRRDLEAAFPGVSIAVDGKSASHSHPLSFEEGVAEDLLAAAEAVAGLIEAGRPLGVEISFEFEGSQTNPSAPWHTYKWRFQTELSPARVVERMNVPGVRISTIAWSEGGRWSVEGVLYAQ